MSVIVYPSGASTLILNGYAFTGFAEGSEIALEPLNPLSEATISQDGGMSINERIDRDVYDLTIRLQRNCPDDAMVNMWRNAPGIMVFDGSLKCPMIRDGKPTTESWQFSTVRITTQPGSDVNNQDAENVSEWKFNMRVGRRMV